MTTIKELPSYICFGLIILWFIVISLLKLMTSTVESSMDNNKYDLLLFQTQQATSPLKKQRKSALGKLFEHDPDFKNEKIKKNDKVKEENLKACLESNFDINSLDRHEDY